MRLPLAALLLSLAALASPSHAQQQPPSDIDLKTSYCLGVLQVRVRELTKGNGKINSPKILQSIADMHEDQERLRLYLLQKADYLDNGALVLAHSRAEADLTRSTADWTACGNVCVTEPITAGTIDKATACTDACAAKSEAWQRMQACRPVNWLPF